jgi:hypothetical protein
MAISLNQEAGVFYSHAKPTRANLGLKNFFIVFFRTFNYHSD